MVEWFVGLLGWVWGVSILILLVYPCSFAGISIITGVRLDVVVLKFELDSIIRSPVRVMPSFVKRSSVPIDSEPVLKRGLGWVFFICFGVVPSFVGRGMCC